MKRALFLAPHLDDVALSATKACLQLRQEGFEIHVATIFSNDKPQSPSKSDFTPWTQTTATTRKDEDNEACSRLQAKCVHVDMLDAPFRQSRYKNLKELLFFYKQDEKKTLNEVVGKIDSLIQTLQPDKIFAPLGIGWHVDHQIVFEAVRQLADRFGANKFYFYEDRPYAMMKYATDLRLAELGYQKSSSPLRTKATLILKSLIFMKEFFGLEMNKSLLKTPTDKILISFYLLAKLSRLIAKSGAQTEWPQSQLFLGNQKDLETASEIAQTYRSQFPFLFMSPGHFSLRSQYYAKLLNPKSVYCERIWLLR